MVRFITGGNGKGKSKVLLEMVNAEVKEILGNIVFLDTTTKHMYELNNKIRLINTSEYMLKSSDMFVGFIAGIVSQDHDLQQLYFDNFLTIANCTINDLGTVIPLLDELSNKFGIDMVLSVSTSDGELPKEFADRVIEAL